MNLTGMLRHGSFLPAVIDNLRPVIEESTGVLPLAERMEVFSRADVPARQGEAISDALMALGSTDQKHDLLSPTNTADFLSWLMYSSGSDDRSA